MMSTSSVIIESIGEADASLVGRLGAALDLPARQIAAALYRAPSLLAAGLDEAAAERLRAAAAAAGLAVSVRPDGALDAAGDDEHELAVHVPDVARTPAVAALVERLVGCDAATAAALLWSTPALILGRISAATAAALARRLAAAGAEVDIGRPGASTFELHLAEPGRRGEVEPVLRDIMLAHPGRPSPSLLAGDLDIAAAQAAWERARRHRLPVQVIDRALARADLVLEATTDPPATARVLIDALKIPADAAGKLLAHLPLVVGRGLRLADAEAAHDALATAGARASVRLHALQRFVLRIDALDRLDRASGDLAALFGDRPEAMRERLRRLPAVFGGPWSPLHARWLAHAARSVGAATTLLEHHERS